MIANQHLLGVRDLAAEQITAVLDTAEGFREVSRRRIKKVPSLRGRTILNVFYEASTRPRVSFEIAGKRLSADTINLSSGGSSAAKGESLQDTAQTLDAMQPDAVVLRHAASGAAAFVAERIQARVVNAGDGSHEHPTQALLDLLTMRRRFGRIEGLHVAIVGDVLHSRVARSNLLALRTMGARVRVCGPATLLPRDVARTFGCEVVQNVDQAVEGVDVVMVLRLQRERMVGGLLPSLREYSIEYGIDARRVARTRPEAIVMHPGPVNRGVELAPDVLDGPRSLVLDQVESGVAVRAAVLYLILGGDTA